MLPVISDQEQDRNSNVPHSAEISPKTKKGFEKSSDVDPDLVGSAFIWVRGSGSVFRMRIQIQRYNMKEKTGFFFVRNYIFQVWKKVANLKGFCIDLIFSISWLLKDGLKLIWFRIHNFFWIRIRIRSIRIHITGKSVYCLIKQILFIIEPKEIRIIYE